MHQWIPNILFFVILPGVLFYFFCVYGKSPFSLFRCGLYVVTWAFLLRLEMELHLSGLPGLLMGILLLSLLGYSAVKQKTPLTPSAALFISILIHTVYYVSHGAMQLLSFWFLDKLSKPYSALQGISLYLDHISIFASIALTVFLLLFIQKHFFQKTDKVQKLLLCLFMLPTFFISLVEQTIETWIYGDTIVWDSHLGIIFPHIPHKEMLFLQLCAFFCLLIVLILYQKIDKALRDEQSLRLLEQQTRIQEIYLQEAQARLTQTKAFRHDIQNHLLVVTQLLQNGQIDQAREYLSLLEPSATALSFPIQTGLPAADALLGSKLAMASEEKISIQCDLSLPSSTQISHLDWCILLSNALDNAIAANRLVPEQERLLSISGKKKGNFYLLSIKNRCSDHLREIPPYGTGLSNIRATVEKHGGTLQVKIEEGFFHLDILLVLSSDSHSE